MSPQLARYHRLAQANRARGLTAHGTVRQRREKLTPEQKREYNTAKFRLRSERLFHRDLTTRGTRRKIRVGRMPVLGEFKQRVANAIVATDRYKSLAHAAAGKLLALSAVPAQ